MGNASGAPRADRHNEGANYAFADGHVKKFRYRGTTTPGSPIWEGMDYNGDGVACSGCTAWQ